MSSPTDPLREPRDSGNGGAAPMEREAFLSALERLRPEERSIIISKYVDGLSDDSAMELLQMDRETYTFHLPRAEASLANALMTAGFRAFASPERWHQIRFESRRLPSNDVALRVASATLAAAVAPTTAMSTTVAMSPGTKSTTVLRGSMVSGGRLGVPWIRVLWFVGGGILLSAIGWVAFPLFVGPATTPEAASNAGSPRPDLKPKEAPSVIPMVPLTAALPAIPIRKQSSPMGVVLDGTVKILTAAGLADLPAGVVRAGEHTRKKYPELASISAPVVGGRYSIEFPDFQKLLDFEIEGTPFLELYQLRRTSSFGFPESPGFYSIPEVVLARAGSVRARVVSSADTAVMNATCTLTRSDGGRMQFDNVTDASGIADFSHVPPGEYILNVACGMLRASVTLQVSAGVTTDLPSPVILPNEVDVRVHLESDGPAPTRLAGARIRIDPYETVADETGAFILKLPASQASTRVRMTVTHPDLLTPRRIEIILSHATTDPVVSIQSTRNMLLDLRAFDGSPVDATLLKCKEETSRQQLTFEPVTPGIVSVSIKRIAAKSTLQDLSSPDPAEYIADQSALSSTVIRDPAVTYMVVAYPQHAPRLVHLDQNFAKASRTLRRGLDVSGFVKSRSGASLPNASVRAYLGNYEVHSTLTDAAGGFFIANSPPRIRLVVAAAGHATVQVPYTTLTGSDGTPQMWPSPVILDPACTLILHPHSSDTEPFTMALTRIDSTGIKSFEYTVRPEIATVITGLSRGTYNVSREGVLEGMVSNPDSVYPVNIEGSTTNFQFPASVVAPFTGTIAANAVVLTDLSVVVVGTEPDFVAEAPCKPDGTFRFRGLRKGKYTVHLVRNHSFGESLAASGMTFAQMAAWVGAHSLRNLGTVDVPGESFTPSDITVPNATWNLSGVNTNASVIVSLIPVSTGPDGIFRRGRQLVHFSLPEQKQALETRKFLAGTYEVRITTKNSSPVQTMTMTIPG